MHQVSSIIQTLFVRKQDCCHIVMLSISSVLFVQENAYWLMNINSYKFGVPGQGSSYFDPYEVNDHLSRMDINRSAWDYPSALNVEDPPEIDTHSGENRVLNMHAIPEEC